ncbi:MAG: cell division protein FtsZ [Leeuwenhoekiella sp.]
MSNTDFENISFDLPKNQSNVIKVIGVGGGGSNAINHMFAQGIKGVDFVVCNTDAQALENSPVPIKIQLGVSLTEGLGAGANPDVGEQAAIESTEDIKRMLDTNTKMVFITAGMGGGTGTGAAPVIAKMSKELDILTVGIVTIPFQFEGKMRCAQAQTGVERLRAQVDSLIVINNNKLREVYGNLGFKAGFSKADEVLATASRGIAEVITHHYTQNIDLRDAKTVLKGSGTAIMGSSHASGGSRATDAIRKALDSPLLNDNKITGAQNVLLLIVSGTEEITIDEIGEINDHIQDEAGHSANIIMGVGEDETLGDAISVTIIATGFDVEQQNEIVNTETKKIIHTLEDEQRAQQNLSPKNNMGSVSFIAKPAETPKPEKIVHTLKLDEEPENPKAELIKPVAAPQKPVVEEKPKSDLIPTSEAILNMEVTYEEVKAQQEEMMDFEIIDVSEREDVSPIETEDAEDQFSFTFDMPLAENDTEDPSEETAEKTVFNLGDDDLNDIEVNDAVEVVSITETSETGETRYSLDDYMEVENQLSAAKEEKSEDMPTIVKKHVVVSPEKPDVNEDDEDPTNSPISKILTERAAQRRKVMKEFNYKFNQNHARIEDIEKQPAYKRLGVELDENPEANGNVSRTTLNIDEDGINMRKNNSFLHDNVD